MDTIVKLSENKEVRLQATFYYPDKRKSLKNQRTTFCRISYFDVDENKWKLLSVANVSCYSTDKFSKSIGRKKAFEKALRLPIFTKPFRTILWKAFIGKYGVN